MNPVLDIQALENSSHHRECTQEQVLGQQVSHRKAKAEITQSRCTEKGMWHRFSWGPAATWHCVCSSRLTHRYLTRDSNASLPGKQQPTSWGSCHLNAHPVFLLGNPCVVSSDLPPLCHKVFSSTYRIIILTVFLRTNSY